jgi:hypothetical protein
MNGYDLMKKIQADPKKSAWRIMKEVWANDDAVLVDLLFQQLVEETEEGWPWAVLTIRQSDDLVDTINLLRYTLAERNYPAAYRLTYKNGVKCTILFPWLEPADKQETVRVLE